MQHTADLEIFVAKYTQTMKKTNKIYFTTDNHYSQNIFFAHFHSTTS